MAPVSLPNGAQTYAGETAITVLSPSPEVMTKEAVAGGTRQPFGGGYIPFEETPFDKALQKYGITRIVNIMLADPKVSSTFDKLKMSVLADGIQVTSAILPRFGVESDNSDEGDVPITDQDVEDADEIGKFCARLLDRIINPDPMETFIWQLMDSWLYGVKLGEMVFRVQEDGIDAGKLVIDRIKVKTQQAWSFVIDGLGNILGIAAAFVFGYTPAYYLNETKDGKYALLPREKFVISTWNPQDDDPRGRTILRRVYDAFFDKFQTRMDYRKYLRKFAAPTWVGITSAEATPRTIRDKQSGQVKNSDKSPEDDMLDALVKLEDCSAIAVKHGGDVKAVFPNGNGESFMNGLGYFDKQIVAAIIQTARATEESQFGSRADSETSQDDVGVVIRFLKQKNSRMIRDQICRMAVELNYGKEKADRFTPSISLGLIEHQDFSRNANAVGKLWASGFLDETQRPGLCRFIGIDRPKMRSPEEQPIQAATGKTTVPPKDPEDEKKAA